MFLYFSFINDSYGCSHVANNLYDRTFVMFQESPRDTTNESKPNRGAQRPQEQSDFASVMKIMPALCTGGCNESVLETSQRGACSEIKVEIARDKAEPESQVSVASSSLFSESAPRLSNATQHKHTWYVLAALCVIRSECSLCSPNTCLGMQSSGKQ